MSILLSKNLTWIVLVCSILIIVLPSGQIFAQNSNFDVIIVTNKLSDISSVTKQQIRHVFMGGGLSGQYKAINLLAGDPLRVKFNTKILGLTESRIQSYWAQMKFTGRNKPPMELSVTQEVIDYMISNENAVAYLPADAKIPEQLKIIYPSLSTQ